MQNHIAHVRHAAAFNQGESGFTLLEVLVVCLLLALAVGAVTTTLAASANTQLRDASYSYAQEQARAGLDSMVSQIRQATAILASTPNSVDMNVNLNGTALQVYYECDIPQTGTTYRECVRVQSAQGTALPPLTTGSVVLRNLQNGTSTSPIFTFYPVSVSPDYMTATVDVPASAGLHGGLTSSIVLSDGALMRNLNVGD